MIKKVKTLFNAVLVVGLLVTLTDCQSETCDGENPSAKVESSSANYKVWVWFNNQDTEQTFQVIDVTEDNAKRLSDLPAGQYSIQAIVYAGTGPKDIRLSAKLKECVDYNLYVNATSYSMTLSGKAK